jgi:hypothetical protein
MGRKRNGGTKRASPVQARKESDPPALSPLDRVTATSGGLRAIRVLLSALLSLAGGLSVGTIFALPGRIGGLDADVTRALALAGLGLGCGVGACFIEARRTASQTLSVVVTAVVLVFGLDASGVGGLWAAGASWLAAVGLAEYLAPSVSLPRGPG